MALGYEYPDIPLLQPADPFLDTTGEDLRRRIFITHDIKGRILCLRPEFTIPVCLAHLQNDRTHGCYAYGGSVFRQHYKGSSEFSQAGVEIIGNTGAANTRQRAASDVKCLDTALDALACCGLDETQTLFGDKAIFEALLIALDLPQGWRERLVRAFGDNKKLANDLKSITDSNNNNISAELSGISDNSSYHDILRKVIDKMEIASLPSSGGREPSHIAERIMEKAKLETNRLSNEQREILNAFLQIRVPVDGATEKLREFCVSASINIGEPMETFAQRSDLLASSHKRAGNIVWQASFGRKLDYYTGIAFEIYRVNMNRPVCGGGRYDKLMSMLGAKRAMPAIGFSIWPGRLQGGNK